MEPEILNTPSCISTSKSRSHWTTVIRPQNGNKSAHRGFCHGDLWARWCAESMDQGQERRWGVWGKEKGVKLASLFVSMCLGMKQKGEWNRDPSFLIYVERFLEFVNRDCTNELYGLMFDMSSWTNSNLIVHAGSVCNNWLAHDSQYNGLTNVTYWGNSFNTNAFLSLTIMSFTTDHWLWLSW